MKKGLKITLICLSVVLILAIVAGGFLYFSSPKFKLTHSSIERVYIYHNELDREHYVFTDDEKNKLVEILDSAEIGRSALKDYVAVDGGPWFSFFCELKKGGTVQIYCDGIYLHIDSIPYNIDKTSAEKLLELHREIEDKILPISEEEYQEILDKRKNS